MHCDNIRLHCGLHCFAFFHERVHQCVHRIWQLRKAENCKSHPTTTYVVQVVHLMECFACCTELHLYRYMYVFVRLFAKNSKIILHINLKICMYIMLLERK